MNFNWKYSLIGSVILIIVLVVIELAFGADSTKEVPGGTPKTPTVPSVDSVYQL